MKLKSLTGLSGLNHSRTRKEVLGTHFMGGNWMQWYSLSTSIHSNGLLNEVEEQQSPFLVTLTLVSQSLLNGKQQTAVLRYNLRMDNVIIVL